MDAELRDFERRVTAEAELLRQLPAVALPDATLARVRSAVVAAGQQAAARRRWVRRGQLVSGLAAAVLLTIGINVTSRELARPDPWLASSATLDDWSVAWDESGTRITRLLDDGWLGAGFGDEIDSTDDAEAYLDSVEQSLTTFGTL